MSLRSVSSICPVDYEKQLFVYFILFLPKVVNHWQAGCLTAVGSDCERNGIRYSHHLLQG